MAIRSCGNELARHGVSGGTPLAEIVAAGLKRKEIRPDVDAKEVATLIISSLEGALMIARLERNKEALLTAQSHLERYLETEVCLHSRLR